MSYPPPPGPYPPAQPPSHKGRTFLNLSGGCAALAIAAGVLLLIACIGGCAFFGVMLAGGPDPTVQITSCEIEGSIAEIGYTITNTDTISRTTTVTFVIKDAAGAQVGVDDEWIQDLAAGTSANRTATVIADTRTGATCHVSKIS